MTQFSHEDIERLRSRVRDAPDITQADTEAILTFSDQLLLLASEYSVARHASYLVRLRNMAESVGGLANALEDRTAAEDIVRWIHATYDNPETNRDYRITLRMFGEHATEGDGKPESVSWIPSTYPSTYDPAPEPSDLLRWEDDIVPMIDASRTLRDRSVIALAFDAGPRSGELQALDVGDVTDHEFGLQVTLSR